MRFRRIGQLCRAAAKVNVIFALQWKLPPVQRS
jgi:hypothetical protein